MQICDALCEAMDSLAPRVDLYIKEMAESGDYRNARFQVTIILYQSNNGSGKSRGEDSILNTDFRCISQKCVGNLCCNAIC